MPRPDVETRPVGPADLADLADLFEGQRSTRHCWCTAFCVSSTRFAVGWVTGGNRGRFEAIATSGGPPMGVLASAAGAPVGWCACGPRSRYVAGGRSRLLRDRTHREDDDVWLLPCLFVRDGHRGQGVSLALVRAAVELARLADALAVEAWPSTDPDPTSADAFLGREQVFAGLGFRTVARPEPKRSIMRLELRVV